VISIPNVGRNRPFFYLKNSSFPKLEYGTEGAKLYLDLILTGRFYKVPIIKKTLTNKRFENI